MKMHILLQALAGLALGAHSVNGTVATNNTITVQGNIQARQCLIGVCSQMCTGMSKRDGAQMSVACRICLLKNASARKCYKLSPERPTQYPRPSYGSHDSLEYETEQDDKGPMTGGPASSGQPGQGPGPAAPGSMGQGVEESDPAHSIYDSAPSRTQEPPSGSKSEMQHKMQSPPGSMPQPQPQDQQHNMQPQQDSMSQPQPQSQPFSSYEDEGYPNMSSGDDSYSDGGSDGDSGGSSRSVSTDSYGGRSGNNGGSGDRSDGYGQDSYGQDY